MLRLYGIALAVLLMAVETEFQCLMALARVLESWVGRGLVQVRPPSRPPSIPYPILS